MRKKEEEHGAIQPSWLPPIPVAMEELDEKE